MASNPFNIIASFFVRPHFLQPTTNAGRYLRQLEFGDLQFAQAGEAIDEELECALKRIDVVSRREQKA